MLGNSWAAELHGVSSVSPSSTRDAFLSKIFSRCPRHPDSCIQPRNFHSTISYRSAGVIQFSTNVCVATVNHRNSEPCQISQRTTVAACSCDFCPLGQFPKLGSTCGWPSQRWWIFHSGHLRHYDVFNTVTSLSHTLPHVLKQNNFAGCLNMDKQLQWDWEILRPFSR
jgi:hypothetical protein